MAPPKISVVTVSYNQAGYIERTIQSVLDQGYSNLEYIIIDGGSTDGSQEIIQRYQKHLAYWVSEKDKGMYDGLQKGLSRSTGEIMAWINSDDIFHAGAFNVVSEIFSAHPKVEWLQGMPTVIDEQGRVVYVKNFRRWSKYDYFLKDKEHIQQESCFWRRALWERAGGSLNTSMKYAGDYELWLRYFDHAAVYCVKTVLGAFRMRSSNQLSLEKMEDYNREVDAVLSKRMAVMTSQEKQNLQELLKPANKRSIFGGGNNRHPDEIKEYPPSISFDRTTQSFRIDE